MFTDTLPNDSFLLLPVILDQDLLQNRSQNLMRKISKFPMEPFPTASPEPAPNLLTTCLQCQPLPLPLCTQH